MTKFASVILTAVTSVFACNAAYAKVLERADLSGLSVREEPSTSGNRLHVRLWLTDSMRIIGKPRTKLSGKTLKLSLPLQVFSKANEIAGMADFFVLVPAGMERLTLGTRECEIWPHDIGAPEIPFDKKKAQECALKQFTIDFPTEDLFYVSSHVSEYHTPKEFTYLKLEKPGYEVVVAHSKGRAIYQISATDFSILKRVDQ